MQECIETLKGEYPGVNYRALMIDLSSQKAVRAAAAEFLSWTDLPPLNILINNAGIGGLPERTISEDGIEMHLATNHVGHWLFTNLILPKFAKGSNGATRIVNVTSGSPTATVMRWSDLSFEKKNKDLPEAEKPMVKMFEAWGYKDIMEASYTPLDGYGRSKVANVLFGIGANKRWLEEHGIVSFSVHPGVIQTELTRYFPQETIDSLMKLFDSGLYRFRSLRASSSTALVAALDPKLAVGVGETVDGNENYGAFMEDCQISDKALPGAVSSAEAEKLWKISEEWAKQEFR